MKNFDGELAEFREKYCDRYMAKSDKEILRYREHDFEPDIRDDFQRDRDRIIHSRAFRRLSGKTQVFTATKGDHYRTRLTHSLEVCQIGRTIGKSLGLNEDLIEAIALGHDLGHTPFGHVIERTLHDILKNNELENLKTEVVGGFKHNFQSVHLLDNIEMGSRKKRGLNLTIAVREGIIKHTGIKIKSNYNEEKEEVNYETINLESQGLCIMDYEDAITLEGQIVALADEIAQSTHDLEDGVRAGIIKIDSFKDELLVNIVKLTDEISEKKFIHKLLLKLKEKTEELEKDSSKKKVDLSQKMGLLIRELINLFIYDALENSMKNLIKDNCDSINKNGIINKNLIDNSECIKKLRKFISKYIYKHVVSSQEVSQLDSKAKYLIKQIFKAYYKDPRQLPDYTLNRYFAYKGRSLDRTTISNNNNKLQLDPEFLRIICDHIAGMTDVYAIQEYNKLYGTNYYM